MHRTLDATQVGRSFRMGYSVAVSFLLLLLNMFVLSGEIVAIIGPHSLLLTFVVVSAHITNQFPLNDSMECSGVSLVFTDGSSSAGSYYENAAFNPSMLPLQTAIINHLVKSKSSREETIS